MRQWTPYANRRFGVLRLHLAEIFPLVSAPPLRLALTFALTKLLSPSKFYNAITLTQLAPSQVTDPFRLYPQFGSGPLAAACSKLRSIRMKLHCRCIVVKVCMASIRARRDSDLGFLIKVDQPRLARFYMLASTLFRVISPPNLRHTPASTPCPYSLKIENSGDKSGTMVLLRNASRVPSRHPSASSPLSFDAPLSIYSETLRCTLWTLIILTSHWAGIFTELSILALTSSLALNSAFDHITPTINLVSPTLSLAP